MTMTPMDSPAVVAQSAPTWRTAALFACSLVVPVAAAALVISTAVFCLKNADYQFFGEGGADRERHAWLTTTAIVAAPFLVAVATSTAIRLSGRGWRIGLAAAAPILFGVGLVAFASAYSFASQFGVVVEH